MIQTKDARHPMFFQADIMTPEVVRMLFLKDAPGLRKIALDLLSKTNEGNFDEMMPSLHVIFGLYDALVDGRSVTVLTDATNC